MGVANYCMETVFFHGLRLLETHGYARRLSKVTDKQFDGHPFSNLLAVRL